MNHVTIDGLSTATGVKIETIRYYERAGLISPPSRTSGNYRSYAPGDVARLRFIKRTSDLGFSLDEVRALLNLSVQRDMDCYEIDGLASRHLHDVERKIADLMALRQQLSTAINSYRGGSIAECQILEAFSADTH